MDRAQQLFIGTEAEPGFYASCLARKKQTITDEAIELKCRQYARLFGLLDAIWSSVRGIDAGLLPTDAQVESLKVALEKGKALWLEMGLTTLQPKWHLTFDGHLLEQYKLYGGIADKSDETIEAFHQTLMALRERFRGITSYESRENCIRRELRRSKSPVIQKHIDRYERLSKKATGTKRAVEEASRIEDRKRVKREKRDAVIAS